MKLTTALVEDIDRRGRLFAFETEVRAANEDGSIPFKGQASAFNKRYSVYGMFTEEFAPGAFTKTIKEADVRFVINHDANLVLARSKSGTLVLSEDNRGLLVEADMAPTTYALDLAITMKRGDVNQMSHAFRSVKETWDETGKMPHRRVIEAQLFDVSVVTYPVFEGTSAALRSVQFDSMVRALGFDEMEQEQRDALLLQVTGGDIAPEFRPILLRAQERIASLVPAAGDESPRTEQTDEPASGHSGTQQQRQRRAWLMERRQPARANAGVH